MNAITKILMCLAISALTAVATLPAQAQQAPVFRHVDVVGEAEVRSAPDQALVNLGVESWNASLAAAVADNNSKMAALLAVAQRLGIPAKDVRTDNASIEPQYDNGNREPIRSIVGYRVTKLVVVRLTNLSGVDTLVSRALAAGANRLDGVAFGLTDPTPLRAQARSLAVRDALAKARSLAQELGQTVGRPVFLTESSSNPYPVPLYKAMAAPAPMADGAGGAETFAPGQVVVTAQVSAQFELKD